MSVFRIVYRQLEADRRPPEDVEAVEFVQMEPWIVFLDPAGTCLTVRTEHVEHIERVPLMLPVPQPETSLPSDLPLG